MDDLTNAALYLGQGAGIGVVVGLVEVVKRAAALSDSTWMRIVPLISLLIGAAWEGLVMAQLGIPLSPVTVAFLGIVTGLAASGTWSGVKAAMGK